MMKDDNRLRELLQNADPQDIEQITAGDSAARQRIWQEIRSRRHAEAPTEDAEREGFLVTEAKPQNPLRYIGYAGVAAAFLLIAGMAGYFSLKHPPQLPAAQEETLAATDGMYTETEPMPAAETLPAETEPVELTKELLYQRCTSTILRLGKLSGHVEIYAWMPGSRYIRSADLQLDYDNARFYGRTKQLFKDFGEVVQQQERFVSDGREVSFVDTEECDFIYADGEPGHNDKQSCCIYQGSMEVVRSTTAGDPTGFHEFAECFAPKDMTMGYLSDLNKWELTDRIEYQNRDCAVIEGTTDDYGSRFNVTHFRIYVDIETGVWLFYEGYGENGEVNGYLHTEGIAFDENASEVSVITEEEIDERIANGYPITDDRSLDYYQRMRAGKMTLEPQPTDAPEPAVLPESMPEPFDGEAPYAYSNPCEHRFTDIPQALTDLIPEGAADWTAQDGSLACRSSDCPTSLKQQANLYTFIQFYSLTDEQVRTALADRIKAWDPEISLREDELEAILSGNETAMLQDFANYSTIVIGAQYYTPEWMYTHSIEDYRTAGITPEMVQERSCEMLLEEFTEEARAAFAAKLRYYCENYEM